MMLSWKMETVTELDPCGRDGERIIRGAHMNIYFDGELDEGAIKELTTFMHDFAKRQHERNKKENA